MLLVFVTIFPLLKSKSRRQIAFIRWTRGSGRLKGKIRENILMDLSLRPRPMIPGSYGGSKMSFFAMVLQGDYSGCAKPPVDIKAKVPF